MSGHKNGAMFRRIKGGDGPASAHHIQIPKEDGLLASNDLNQKTPFTTLRSGKHFDVVASPQGSVFSIALSWEHDAGGTGYRESPVSQ